MRRFRTICAASALALLTFVPALQAAAPATTSSQSELVDLGVRPASVSIAADGHGYAAAYDDRLAANALRFAVRVDGRWSSTVVASTIAGRRVGREPQLAISHTGIRLIGFRSDSILDPALAPSGALYVARSTRNGPWIVDPIDADGFGESVAFDHQGHPAIAYLARTGVGDQAAVRLARLTGGEWQVQELELTTYREAPGGSNASSVGLAFDHSGQPWVSFVDPASHSVRLVTPGQPSIRVGDAPSAAARAVVSFGANGAEAVVAAGLVGDNEPLRLVYRAQNGRWRGDQVGESGSSAPTIVSFSGRRPVIAFRDPDSVSLATPSFAGTYAFETVLKQAAPPSSRVAGSLGAALVGGDIGVALVSPKGLLEFSYRALG
ncbi:MAG: hypothetical protein ABI317_14205 [Gaiellales bacterium]